MKRQIEEGAVFFNINLDNVNVKHQNTQYNKLYDPTQKKGFVRKAIVTRVQSAQTADKFVDHEFTLAAPPNHRMVRLYDLYQKDTNLFPLEQQESSYFSPQQNYNSFMAESGVISYQYLRTLFVTQLVNSKGYYQYFVKRNGEYYLQQCDDFIPVDKQTWKPIWGLELEHPWQIILFKAWAKEVGSIEKMYQSEPFSFLQAFGLPEYQVFNFRKEKKFIVNESVNQQYKDQKLSHFALNRDTITIIGKTVNNEAVRKMGLIPNMAGYKIMKINKNNEGNLYHVYSSLPCSWVGTHSAVYKTALNKIHETDMDLDLERNFLATQQQLLTYFSKFFVIPSVMNDASKFALQDCFNIYVNAKPVWLRVTVPQSGTLGLSIEMPKQRVPPKNVYPEFRYFFSRRLDQKQMSRSHFRQDIAGSRAQQNMYITSNCDKWEFYLIDFVQGYENHSSKFAIVDPGEYVLFIHADLIGNIRVRFDSHIKIEEPVQYQPTAAEAKQIFDSTFFSISKETAVEATFNAKTFEESIALNNAFEQLGFGSICIKTLVKAQHKVAMRVYPDRLRAAGLQLPEHYSELQLNNEKQKNFVLVSSKGRPEIIVLERINNRSRTQIGQIFPPPGTVEFFKVTPNRMIGTSSIGANQVMQSNVRPVNMAPSNISNPQSSYVKPNVGYSQVPNNQVQPNITVSQPTGVQVIQGGQPVQNSFLGQR